jgi:hypothetical protein
MPQTEARNYPMDGNVHICAMMTLICAMTTLLTAVGALILAVAGRAALAPDVVGYSAASARLVTAEFHAADATSTRITARTGRRSATPA